MDATNCNLQEYRVRKAHHVIVREQDMLRYLGILIVISIVGLLGWTFGSYKDKQLWKDKWPQCSMDLWSLMWAIFEMIVLILGMRFCYKARSSHWTERNQFTIAVCCEALVTFIATVVRYSYRENGSRDIMLLISFCQIFVAVTANILIIITPKFVSVGGESNRRTLTMSGAGNSGRAHPSLAKLRDNLINGTIDFAEGGTQTDNPHISKRKGGKKTSDKTAKNRRISIPPTSSSPKIRRVDEEDEKSDLTVDSAPHNIYLSTNKIQLQLESADQSVRV
uniref:G-protein coupled receptors family 3 profile domain-containing protein n=1 Tax=Panagrolaimus sp. ES5 TaxID=591445 RepID=A0AC34FVV0_9BILA